MDKVYTTDIVIVGAGIVGLTLALLLTKHTTYHVMIIESDSRQALFTSTGRVIAMNALTVQLWQHLNVWERIHTEAAPYTRMRVWNEGGSTLSFDAAPEIQATLGYIVPNTAVQQALLQKVHTQHAIRLLVEHPGVELLQQEQEVRLRAQNAVIHAQYVIGCDGATSWVRQQAQIPCTHWPYAHTALVARVTSTLPHRQTARQKFTSQGPLAFLPLVDPYTSSIVWSVPSERAQQLLALSAEDFAQQLSVVSEEILGKITLVSACTSFVLKMQHAQHYVDRRIILCGDAAHTFHPLAGQGLNVALQDVIALSDVFISLPQHASVSRLLGHYARARQAENWRMILTIEAIKRTYSSKNPLWHGLVARGMRGINDADIVKKFLLKMATGKSYDAPEWLHDSY